MRMKHREMQLPGCQDATLFAQAWLPEREPSVVVVISHGLAEHSGRYTDLAARLVAHGYAVYALDHRGHGRSSGVRANIERFSYLVSDLSAFVGRAQRQHPDATTFLVGHSMGGAVALASVLRNPGGLKGLVLSAPAVAAGEVASPVKAFAVRLLSRLAPSTGALTLPAAAISRDPAVVRAYESDPLVFRESIPARTLVELLQAMAAFPDSVPKLKIPVLVQHGTADRLVPLAAARPVYERLGSPKLRTIRLYEGLFHEAYNEPERDQVIADLEAWIDGQR
jgi:alpha-beta hydrolase superfamily lysophospholipase